MTSLQQLTDRSENRCELCASETGLSAYPVAPMADDTAEHNVLLCNACRAQVEGDAPMDPHHWRCLNDSMWSQVPAVQVMAWRILNELATTEGWAGDLRDQMYLDDDTRQWAEITGGSGSAEGGDGEHRDCNGAVLAAGDTVTLIKDLKVKGANFTAKRGTAVRGISLVPDNPAQIEGRVSGQQIVILTEFVKKS